MNNRMDEKQKSNMEKEKVDEVKNRATDTKKSLSTDVNNRMDKRKKFIIEKEKKRK